MTNFVEEEYYDDPNVSSIDVNYTTEYVLPVTNKNNLINESKEIIIYCQNFNRMKSAVKVNEIYRQVAACSFPVILGTETSWDVSINNEEVFGDRFNVYRDDRDKSLSNKKSGGGVLIAVCTNYESEQITSNKCKEFDHVWVKSTFGNQIHIFAAVYFPPESARKESYEKFFSIASNIISKFEPETNVHIYGDFNQRAANFIVDDENESLLIPIVGDNETLHSLFDKSSEIGLNQVNHVRNHNNCYLDLLFTNMTDDFCVIEAPDPLWKNEVFHTAIEYSLFIHDNTTTLDGDLTESYFDFKQANYIIIKNKLSSIDWQTLIRNLNLEQAVDTFYQIMYDILETSVPKKKRKKSHKSKSPPWYNRIIINLKNRKQKAHKAYKRDINNTNLTIYLAICDQLNLEIKNAYEEYNIRVENNIKSDPKSFFSFVKDKQKSNNFPSKMQLDNRTGKTADEISNLFADFFQDVYTTHSDNDRDYQYFSYLPEPLRNITVGNISVNEILLSLNALDASKGAGPDGLPPVFLKSVSKELVKPLYWLFNLSLESSTLPPIWKESFLIPIFKSGKKSDVKNYRGIAILSCIPKLLESIINQNIFSQVKNLISSKQHGFVKGRSTITNLLNFVTFSINAMDRGNYVEALYTDFSKAFDRVDIPLLLFKLSKLGFNDGLLKWVQSYLTGRTQRVRFEGNLSPIVNVTSGVPQGSHLGPLLFILFVNDVEHILNFLNVSIYADDMKLFLEIAKASDIVIFQREIDTFNTWCTKSLLELNVKKCNSISFTRKHITRQENINIGHKIVERCSQVRDLGVILDSKLTFVDHYNNIIFKSSNVLGFIKRFSLHFNDPYTIKTLYVAYVRPLLEYCSIVWAPYQDTHINRIESVQKQFLLFALRKLGWSTLPLPSYESRCMLIDLDGLKKRREFAMISFINDVIAQRVNTTDVLENLNFYAPTRSLRNRNLFYINNQRTNYAKNGPINRMMSCYNKYCEIIDVTMNKTTLKKTFFTRLASN